MASDRLLSRELGFGQGVGPWRVGVAGLTITILLARTIPRYPARGRRCDRGGKRELVEPWLRKPNRWFRWWKQFLMATGEECEKRQIRHETDAGLHYILALYELPRLPSVFFEGADANAQGGQYGNAL